MLENSSQNVEGEENVEILTKGFITLRDSICRTLAKILSGNEAKQILVDELKVERASKFEIGMYLLFRLDQMMCGKQKQTARQALFNSCMNKILPSSSDDCFSNVVRHRLCVYGDILNKTRESGRDWGDVIQMCHNWLNNSIQFCNDDFEKMKTEDMPTALNSFRNYVVLSALQSVELHTITLFTCALKHVFLDNDDFRLIPEGELLRRIAAGQKEGLSITKKTSDDSIQQ